MVAHLISVTTSDRPDPDSHAALDALGWDLLARYFSGTASESDIATLRAWLGTDVVRRRELDALRAIWERAEDVDSAPAPNVDDAWTAMIGQLDAASAGSSLPAPASAPAPATARRRTAVPRVGARDDAASAPRWRRAARWSGVVAAAALIVAVMTRPGARAPVQPHTPAASVALTEVTTKRGQRAQVRLSDGTRVVLNVDSRLRYAPDFGTHVRDVYLEGEAFFEVEHDEAKPFVVHTARATARDLGTQFTVRAYGDTASVTVAVMEGIVALAPVTPGAIALDGAAGASARAASKVDSLVLVARDVGEVSASGRLSMQRGVDTDVYAAWTRGTLAFNDTPLREVVATLNRWYDADVRLGDASIGNELFTASFSAESLSDVIAAMSTVLHLRVERRGAVMALHRHAVR